MAVKQNSQKERDEDIGGMIILGACLFAPVAIYVYRFVEATRAFLFYRRLLCSNPPLSTQAKRGHFLTPEWAKYFRHALAVSCSFMIFHGLFSLLVYLPSLWVCALFVFGIIWLAGTFLAPLFPAFHNYAMPKKTHFALSLPDFVLENGVIDHEAIELIRQAKRAREMRRERQEHDIRKKYDADRSRLRKEIQ